MQKFIFNIRAFVGIHKIPQEKIKYIFDHQKQNYKLEDKLVCIHNASLKDDKNSICGKLVDIKELEDCIQFSIEVEGLAILHTLSPDEIIVFFEPNKEETEFTPCYVYWDDKYPPVDGINFKTLVNVSFLTVWQLYSYFDKAEYELRNRNCFVHSSSINYHNQPVISGKFTGIVGTNYANVKSKDDREFASKAPYQISVACDGFIANQRVGVVNNDVLILMDKNEVKPQYIYWEKE